MTPKKTSGATSGPRAGIFCASRSQAGMSIIELLVSMVVFSFIVAGVAVAMGGTLGLTRNSRNRSIAANLASIEMDSVRSADFDSLSPGAITTSRTVDSVAYSILRELEWVTKNANTGACDTPTGSKPAYLRVTVSVAWPNMAGAEAPQSQTIITPPVGVYDSTAGHIAVKVSDRDAALAVGHVVHIDGPDGVQTQTLSDGCAFFAYLSPGSYRVWLDTPGSVDQQGNQQPQQILAVQVGAIASASFDYDAAATAVLTVVDNATYALPAIFSLPVKIANPGLLPTGVIAKAGTGPVRTITGLFPYRDGYEYWLGACEDNDPLGQAADGTRLYPTAGRQIVATDPGTTTSADLDTVKLQLTVEDDDGDPEIGEIVTATHSADALCPGYSLTLGTTDVNGKLKSSMAFGTWNLTVDGETRSVLFDPTGPDPQIMTIVTDD